MKKLIATSFAALMIASSSMAFAADNKGNNNDGKNDMDTTGSVNTPDAPTQFDIDRCKTAPADDKTCDPVRSRMQD